MTLSMNKTRNARLAALENQCAQCGECLLAPDWSEYLDERRVRHAWSCEACGYAFETTVVFAAAA